MKRGIYLVANHKSQKLCANLIYSIRESGCLLTIYVIHFGGKKIDSTYILNNVEYLMPEEFSQKALNFISELRTVLMDCPLGYLYRFLPLFHDCDEFLYSDNDIVALTNWETLFSYITDYDIVHADEEYTTHGRFNHDKPEEIKNIFGPHALEAAITAGHFVIKKSDKIVEDMRIAMSWFKSNPEIPKKHDQALLHIASLIGGWKALNLCKPPNNWLSSWSGDYRNSLHLITSINSEIKRSISHIHFSGSVPKGNLPMEDLLLSNLSNKSRLNTYSMSWSKEHFAINLISGKIKKIKRRLIRIFKTSIANK